MCLWSYYCTRPRLDSNSPLAALTAGVTPWSTCLPVTWLFHYVTLVVVAVLLLLLFCCCCWCSVLVVIFVLGWSYVVRGVFEHMDTVFGSLIDVFDFRSVVVVIVFFATSDVTIWQACIQFYIFLAFLFTSVSFSRWC